MLQGLRETGLEGLIEGSWDLVTRVIKKVATFMYTYKRYL